MAARTRSRRKVKSAAIVTVFNAPAMTARGRRDVAKWLRRQAEFVEKHGVVLAKRYSARYRYR